MFRKLLSFVFNRKPLADPNIISGTNSDLSKATIYKPNRDSKICVGDDCLIEGIISTYTPSAKIKIGNNVFIGGNTLIGSACEISIGDDVLISYDCMIQDNDNHPISYALRKNDTRDWKNGQQHNWEITPKKPITINRGAWVGAKSIILKGVTIGEGSVIGAGSVVTKNVEPYTIVAGNPARFIKKIN